MPPFFSHSKVFNISGGNFSNVGRDQYHTSYRTTNHISDSFNSNVTTNYGSYNQIHYYKNSETNPGRVRQTNNTPDFTTSDGHFSNVRGDQNHIIHHTSNHGNFNTTSNGLYDHPGRVRQTNDTPDFTTSDGHFSNVRGDQNLIIHHTSNHGNFSTTSNGLYDQDTGQQSNDTSEEQRQKLGISKREGIGSTPRSAPRPQSQISSPAPAPDRHESPSTTLFVPFQPPDITMSESSIPVTPQLEHGSSFGGDDIQEVQLVTVPIDVRELPSHPQTGSAARVEFVEEQAIAEHRTTSDIRQASSPSSRVPIHVGEQTLEETQGMASHAYDLRATTPAPASPEVSSSPSSDPIIPLHPGPGSNGQELLPNSMPPANQISGWSTVLDLLGSLVHEPEPNTRCFYVTFNIGDHNSTGNGMTLCDHDHHRGRSNSRSNWLRRLYSLPSPKSILIVVLLVMNVYRNGNSYYIHIPKLGSSRRRKHRALSEKEIIYKCGSATNAHCTLNLRCTFISPPTKEDIDDCYAGSKEWIADESL